jgi:hypothetical protein
MLIDNRKKLKRYGILCVDSYNLCRWTGGAFDKMICDVQNVIPEIP